MATVGRLPNVKNIFILFSIEKTGSEVTHRHIMGNEDWFVLFIITTFFSTLWAFSVTIVSSWQSLGAWLLFLWPVKLVMAIDNKSSFLYRDTRNFMWQTTFPTYFENVLYFLRTGNKKSRMINELGHFFESINTFFDNNEWMSNYHFET